MRRKTEARCETFLDANLWALVRLLARRMSGEECYRGAWRFARLELVCPINTRSLKTLQGSLAPRAAAGRGVPCSTPLAAPAARVHGCRSPGRFTPPSAHPLPAAVPAP